MQLIKLKKYFNNSVIFFKTKKFSDNRGFFSEVYSKKDLAKIGILFEFVQDNISLSKNIGTIRGLHFQKPPREQAKLIKVNNGKIQDVVVDLRKTSKYYGKYLSLIISKKNSYQLFIPPGFAHGFCVLEENTEVLYKTSKYYSPKYEESILCTDKNLSIDWKINKNKIFLSQKDKLAKKFINFKTPFN